MSVSENDTKVKSRPINDTTPRSPGLIVKCLAILSRNPFQHPIYSLH